MKSFLLLASCFLLLISCQSAHQGAATSHNKKLIDTIADSKEADKAAASKETEHLKPVHFATGSDTLTTEELSALDVNVNWLQKNDRAVLVLEGHCDEWGDDFFNMQLGDRRARRIKSILIQKGIEADRLIMVVSYGERQPVDPRHTPSAWNKNRRVEFIVR